MFREITVRRLSAGTIFKLVGLGLALTLIPFTLVMGVLAFFGASTVSWNQQPLTGWTGLVASPFIGAFLAVCFTMLLGCCMAFGLWAYSWFRPVTLLAKSDNSASA